MYFELSHSHNTNFPDSYKIKNFCLSTDLGWSEIQGVFGKVIYKGYAYTDLTAFLSTHDPESQDLPRGSFTAIMEKGDRIYVVNDVSRQYPIFIDRNSHVITNLTKFDETKYPDVSISINTVDNKIAEVYNPIEFSPSSDQSLEQTSMNILEMLNKDINFFNRHYTSPIKVIPTGGFDSTLLIALLKHNNIEFEVIDYEYKKWTYFYKKNRKEVDLIIPANSFMKVGHSWGDVPTTLANGWHADQHFFRLYLPFVVFCKMKSMKVSDVFETYSKSYSYHKLVHKIHERKNDSGSVTDNTFDTKTGYKKIFEIIRASFEPWTFERTLYWSPYRNLNITNQVLQMSDEQVIKNTMEATIQKNILNKIDPNLLDIITPTKNEFDHAVYDKFTKTLTNY